MLYRIPFGGACREMSHRNTQPKFIGQLLQAKLPPPGAITVWVAAIGFYQQFVLANIFQTPNFDPPQSDCSNGEFRCLMRNANHDKAFVGSQVINPIRDSNAVSLTRVVIFQYWNRSPTPRATSILEVADQLSLLRIHADHSLTSFQEAAAHSHHISHLAITLRVLFPCQTFAIDTGRVAQFPQQSPDRDEPDFETFASQSLLKGAQRFAGPSETSNGVTSTGILQQFFQRFQNLRLFFSTACRPPPARRTRLTVLRSRRCTSARPRLMVTRLIPVISCNS